MRDVQNDGNRCKKCGGTFGVSVAGECGNCATPEPRASGWPQGTWLAQRLTELRYERLADEQRGDA